MVLRSPLAILNELSIPTERDYSLRQVAQLLSDFTEVLRASVAIRSDLAMVSPLPLAHTPITRDGLSFATVAQRQGGIVQEQWRYLRSRQNIAPFSAAPDLPIEDLSTEWQFDERRCTGLGLAAGGRQLAISLASDPCWSADELTLQRSVIVEVEDELHLEQEHVIVQHAAATAHVATHRDFIANLALPIPFSGEDLWADKEQRYPSLRFLPRVEGQLRQLRHGAECVSPIHKRLCELDQAVRDWNPATSASPAWRSHVSPENAQRKLLCEFTDDLDGQMHCFDLHARFTPGAGRIHFRIVNEGTRTLRIAHVGQKL